LQQLKKFIPSSVKRRIKTIFNYPSKFIFWLGYNSIYKSKNYKKIKSLKECHKGERCFIIGSGPSISKMDLTLLKNEITFAHNAFYLIAEKVGFLPTYYVVEDQFPAEDNAKEINALHYTQKIVAHDLDYCLNSDNTIYTFLDRNYYDSK